MAILDRIKYDGPEYTLDEEEKKWLVYKFPNENLVVGSQLIVHESQEVVFHYSGKVFDIFGPGRHTLTKANLPLLQKFVNIPFGNNTLFPSEVYYVNKTSRLDMKWGTTSPIQIQDSKFGIIVDIRSFGQFGIKIKDSKKFISEVTGVLLNNELSNSTIVTKYFKGLLGTKIKDTIAKFIIDNKLSIFNISAYLDTISSSCLEKVKKEFDRFGLEVLNLFIESINIPEDNVNKLKEILERKAEFSEIGDDRYISMRELDALNKAASSKGTSGDGLNVLTYFLVKQLIDKESGKNKSKSIEKTTCNKCGSSNPKNNKFCSKCGSALSTEKRKCPSCKEVFQMESRFCPNCGISLEKIKCKKCNFENQPGIKFCGNCGNKMI